VYQKTTPPKYHIHCEVDLLIVFPYNEKYVTVKDMAKPTKDATAITIGVGIVAFVGVLIGLVTHNAIIPLVLLLPTIGYEVYRVEGKSTKWAAWGLLATVVVELALFVFNVSFDLVSFLNTDSESFQGYDVPLGDIKIVGPILMAVFSVVLFKNTRGKYTKALSVIIFLAAFAIVFIMDPDIFNNVLKIATNEGIDLLDSQLN